MESDPTQQSGSIKCYYPLKGFGFIQRQRGRDVFFYRTDAASEEILQDGALVRFSIRQEPKGPRAFEIVRVG